MSPRFPLVAVALILGACGGATTTPADYVPTDHPCTSPGDCNDDQYCGTIGQGTQPAEGAPPPSTTRYCLRKNSGDGYPPSAPPQQ